MKKTIIIHPFLLAIFPILSLYNHNQDMVEITYLIKPLFIALVSAITIFFVLNLIIKNYYKAAVITSLFSILFFVFGHYLSFSPFLKIGKLVIYDHYIFPLFWIIIFLFSTLLILATKKNLKVLTIYLNTVSIFLLLIPLASIVYYEFKTKSLLINLNSKVNNIELNQNESLPNIFYIILDGYGRTDILKEFYGYDNSNFVNYLTNKGFYIANNSKANYPQTYQSLASTLNFEYINYLSGVMGENSDNRKPLKEVIKNNKVYALLKNNGYQIVSFPSSWIGIDDLNSDIKIHYKMNINMFEKTLINITPLKIFMNRETLPDLYRKRLLYTFNHVPDITNFTSPTFTYVHFLAPHPPFVFGKSGEPINPKGRLMGRDGSHYFEVYPDRAEYSKKYIDQLIFINQKTTEMIDKILNQSKQQPVIILQSDHGPGLTLDWENPVKTNMRERMPILNAYYFPGKEYTSLYESISPVNSFRVTFNYILNSNLELLEDKSFFATWSNPYKFINVTDEINN